MARSDPAFTGSAREKVTIHVPEDRVNQMGELAGSVDHNQSAEFRAATETWIGVNELFDDTNLASLTRAERVEYVEQAVREAVDG